MDALLAGYHWSPSGAYLLPSSPSEAFDPQRTAVRWR
jgi:hypothetical protein